MQRFYKFFTLSVLAFAVLWTTASWLGEKIETSVSAQNGTTETCPAQNIFVLEESPTRTLHIVYDLPHGKVHLVQIQKNFNPMVFTVTTKNLTP